MQDAIKTIGIRKSCRNYSVESISQGDLDKVNNLLNQNFNGPMGNGITFKILDFSKSSDEYNGEIGSYGLIKGARLFIGGAIAESTAGFIDYGYCFERIILELTEMGLGTCWMAVSSKKEAVRKNFEVCYGTERNEIIPAVSPFGYKKEKDTFAQSFIRFALRTNNRKGWEELFFDSDGKTLEKSKTGGYADSLDAVRAAPSAVNKQPWRIYKEKDCQNYYFYRKGGHPIDMGIAMLHFELAARQNGLDGEWEKTENPHLIDGMEYTLSWLGR